MGRDAKAIILAIVATYAGFAAVTWLVMRLMPLIV
jgi:hypothetical protein